MLMKWPGGKRRIADALIANLVPPPDVLVEPFVGGGALFFALRKQGWSGTAWLGDRSAAVIAVLRSVRDRVEPLEALLRGLAADYAADPAAAYARWMAEQPDAVAREHLPIQDEEQELRLAAWALAINRTCFNGLWRVNRAGRFNVPRGRFAAGHDIVRAPVLRQASALLQGTRLVHGDFGDTLSRALDRPSDRQRWVYADPPYLPENAGSFVAYAAGGFSIADHRRLMERLRQLASSGVRCLVTNANVPAARAMGEEFGFHAGLAPEIRRSISAGAAGRAVRRDLLLRSDAPVAEPEGAQARRDREALEAAGQMALGAG